MAEIRAHAERQTPFAALRPCAIAALVSLKSSKAFARHGAWSQDWGCNHRFQSAHGRVILAHMSDEMREKHIEAFLNRRKEDISWYILAV